MVTGVSVYVLASLRFATLKGFGQRKIIYRWDGSAIERVRSISTSIQMSRSFKSRPASVHIWHFLQPTRFFFIGTSKFWPSLIVLKFKHNLNLNCS